MKNMLKNKTSLIIVCVFIGILICHFTMCGCKSNYGLIEGLTPNATPPPAAAPAPAAAPTKIKPAAAAPAKPNQLGDAFETAKAMLGASSPSSMTTGAVGDTEPSESSGSPLTPGSTAAPGSSTSSESTVGNEGFTPNSRPIGYGSLQESKSDEWNLSKWVKDAMRYAKGMGNENRLDSYQYNTGPKIPLPEGEMFFFKDTKFSPQCHGTYSNSLGSACLSKPQFNYLMMRGGNHTAPPGQNSYINEY